MIGDVAGVAGVVVALIALGYAIYEGIAARAEAADERRKQFELGILAEISRQWAISHTYQHVAGHVRALIRHDSEELPLLRLGTGVGSPVEGERLMRQVESAVRGGGATSNPSDQPLIRDAVQKRIDAELMEAISSRLR